MAKEGSVKVGDLVKLNKKVTKRGNRDLGTVIKVHNHFYCNVLWLDGRREWVETKLLEGA